MYFRHLPFQGTYIFRPEKDHKLQIEAFHQLLLSFPDYNEAKADQRPKLVLIGGVRNHNDQSIVESLNLRINELHLKSQVEIITNASHSTLLKYYSRSIIGLHTMWNEHFGIGVVEYMAAGLVPVAHASGGPLMDIVTPVKNEPTGLLFGF